MILPLYQVDKQPHPAPQKAKDFHRGLWFERFFPFYATELPDEAKYDWIKLVSGSCGNLEALELATQRRHDLVKRVGGESLAFKTDWHFATGLGLPHPVENGFAWHPTLGTPYISGAAVKGLVRAWIEAWDETFDEEPDDTACKERLHRWFGSEDKDPTLCSKTTQAGAFIFFDAIPIAQPDLTADIMTPHMGSWYEADDDSPIELANAPADWHPPTPIPFLVVQNATFLFSVAVRQNMPIELKQKAQNELSQVMECLKNALDWLGAGAKTAAGYGRMQTGPDEARRLGNILEAVTKKQEQKQTENQELELLKILSPTQAEEVKTYIDKRRREKQSSLSSILRRGLSEGKWHAYRTKIEAIIKAGNQNN